jgi:hypothetical protein
MRQLDGDPLGLGRLLASLHTLRARATITASDPIVTLCAAKHGEALGPLSPGKRASARTAGWWLRSPSSPANGRSNASCARASWG